jgi:hypothetical protein
MQPHVDQADYGNRSYVVAGAWALLTPAYIFEKHYAYKDPKKSQFLLVMLFCTGAFVKALAMSQSLAFDATLVYAMPVNSASAWFATLVVDSGAWFKG